MSFPSSTRGILNPAAGAQHFGLARYEAALELRPFVERYWIVRWDLTDREPYVVETLPHPCVNAVIEAHQGAVTGVWNAKFQKRLEGKGGAFGIKFRPGGFRPFFGRSVAELTDRVVPMREVFGAGIEAVAAAISPAMEEVEQVAAMDAFLKTIVPAVDPNVETAARAVAIVLEDRDLQKVEQLVERSGIPLRTMQRLFRNYVGVGPKWVIQRYRLQDAAERIAAGAQIDWAALAVDLGYSDQSHFIHDFRRFTGVSPGRFSESVEHS